MSAGARAAWEALNERQRKYLGAVYDADQAAERRIAGLRRDMIKPPPAAEWRWLIYSYIGLRGFADDTSIQAAMRDAKLLDPGAGSTLKVLQERGLIETRGWHRRVGHMLVDTVEVKMTREGRATARTGLGEQRPRPTPPGLLSEWLWSALAKLYRAGTEGMPYGSDAIGLRGDDRPPSWNALLQLRSRRDGAFMEEFTVRREAWPTPASCVPLTPHYRVRATVVAMAHYELHYHCYRELYPTVAADPPATAVVAHAGLADHSRPRPRGLVDRTSWRLLLALHDLERRDRCWLRRRLIDDYQQAGRLVPAEVAAIPNGMLAGHVERETRSTAVVGRLAGRAAGALVQTVAVPNPRWKPGLRETPEAFALICLSELGRAHVREHLATYQTLYPEIRLAEPDGQPSTQTA